jgi:integrase
MLDAAPKVPMYRLDKVEPRWEPRDRIHELLGKLPGHSRDMAIVACATGMRKSEVSGLKRAHVDLKRATAFVPASNAKANNSRVVPLNSDAIAVLTKWIEADKHHAEYVFSFRRRAPIKQISTKVWRRARTAAGLPGFRFHDLRHTWASWQVQAETPLKHLQELGGWATMEMVMRYAHLAPGHLAQYAERSALGPAPGEVSTKSDTVEETPKMARLSA